MVASEQAQQWDKEQGNEGQLEGGPGPDLNCCAARELDRRSVAHPRTVAQLARMPGGRSSAPAISLKGCPCQSQRLVKISSSCMVSHIQGQWQASLKLLMAWQERSIGQALRGRNRTMITWLRLTSLSMLQAENKVTRPLKEAESCRPHIAQKRHFCHSGAVICKAGRDTDNFIGHHGRQQPSIICQESDASCSSSILR